MMSESEDKNSKKYQHGKVFKKRFNFKDRFKYNYNQSSNVSVRPNSMVIVPWNLDNHWKDLNQHLFKSHVMNLPVMGI